MKILFLTDNFPPEFNAPATRTFEHTKEWAKDGAEVTIITGAPNFPEGKVFKGYKNKLYQTEYVEKIKVIRVWTYISANKGFVKRILDYLSFMFASFIAGLFIKTDIIIATSPQFFTVISARWLSFWKRKRWVMEVRDLWPESIKAVGAMNTNPIMTFFEFLEHRMYNSAWKIITVTDSFKVELVEKHRIPATKIEVVKNGINTDMFVPLPQDNTLATQLGLNDKFVIGYIGTHGMAHKLDFILDCARQISDEDIHFLFLGTGAEKDNLLEQKKAMELKNVTLLNPVPKNEVSRYISLLSVGLVNLRRSETFKSVLPSKIFELAAMKKPILLGVEGESKLLVEHYGIGVAFEPENTTDFLEKLHLMKNAPNISNRGFDNMVKDFDRKNLALKMLRFVQN